MCVSLVGCAGDDPVSEPEIAGTGGIVVDPEDESDESSGGQESAEGSGSADDDDSGLPKFDVGAPDGPDGCGGDGEGIVELDAESGGTDRVTITGLLTVDCFQNW